MSNLASRLRELRLTRGLTQKQMAEKAGLSYRIWRAYEGGKRNPTYKGLLNLADFFGVSTEYLTGRDTQKEEIPDESDDYAYYERDPTGIGDAAYYIEVERLNNPEAWCDGKSCKKEQPCSENDIWQCQFEKLLEKKWGIKEPFRQYCNGLACRPEDKERKCEPWEKWLCRDVISKVIPSGYFRGQSKVVLPQNLDEKKERLIDFAIETQEGKRIAIELGDFNPYEDTAPHIINDNILFQNLLVITGWIVLRFTFDQLKNKPEQCQEILRLAIKNDGSEFNEPPVLKARSPNPKCKGKRGRL